MDREVLLGDNVNDNMEHQENTDVLIINGSGEGDIQSGNVPVLDEETPDYSDVEENSEDEEEKQLLIRHKELERREAELNHHRNEEKLRKQEKKQRRKSELRAIKENLDRREAQ